MNIKDFLIDNYIWILAIILITIVTIIGFLADKKKGGKKKENQVTPPQNMINQPANDQAPMQYQQPPVDQQQNQMNNNMGFNYNNSNMGTQPISQMNNTVNNMQPMSTEPQVIPSMTNQTFSMTNPQPVDNIVNNAIPEPMYQPLSEQKPIIKPQNIPNFNNVQSNNNQELNINQTPVESLVENAQNGENMLNSNIQAPYVNLQPTSPVIPQYNQQTYNNPNQMMQAENNNSIVTPNFIPNSITTPEPVNPIPMPQPVMPQQIMQEQMVQPQMPGPMPTYNNIAPMQPNIIQPNQGQNINSAPQPMVSSPQPINFVYGPQNNSNQNM